MALNDELFHYPQELKTRLDETGDLEFKDGSLATSDEIWRFMTEDGPRRYPNLFSNSRYYGLSKDTDLVSGIKRNYFTITLYDRLTNASQNGVPIIFIQGGQTHEPYYAAGGIPTRPGMVNGWATNLKENMDYQEADFRRLQIREIGRQELTVEACQTAKYEIIQQGMVPMALIAPYLCLRCSDIAYGVEAHRHGGIKIPLLMVDFPINRQSDKGYSIEYVADNLRRLTEKIAELRNGKVTDEDIRNEIKLHNQKRKLARDYVNLWWSASTPPTNSEDHTGIMQLGNESNGDPVAAKLVLKESYDEVKERVKNSVKGEGIEDDPVRLFICGSCVNPNPKLVDSMGGVVAGKDDGWSEISVDVEETGDPYEKLAKAIVSFPYELPTEERGHWTSEQVRKSKADGLIFMHQWGCNFQSAVARMVADVVKEDTGIPCITIERAMAESQMGHEQLHSRVEIFIEMLR
ncbi:MAG: 2-hydroxyacyl-CoA dehydratase family protein [Candidatus Methanoperedens sp.]|nr:2-hydroxyacyl-CoA dehydratase family protein [Candidatus Methanoperedens sp.]MCZ7406708.1 2-hydroxyacyl-CoA dehydratase family protein [Candidatus Methanoperedens sp.]